jgi:hypothetical protein
MAVRKAHDRKGDAFRISIPLLPDRDPVTRQTMALLTADSSFAFEGITEPLRDNTLTRNILAFDELPLLKILAGLRYLIEYPHGCVEQKVSRTYPSLAYRDIWRQAGIDDPDPKLDRYVNETLALLRRCQDDNGLIGYWPGDKGTVHLTAYAVEFMATVEDINRDNTYAFPEETYRRACDALERAMRSDYSRYLNNYKYYERSAAVYALVKADRTDMSYLKQLAYQSQEADALSQSRIYSAILESGKKMKRVVNDLESALWNHTVFKLRDGQEVFGGLQRGSVRLGAEIHGSEIGGLAGLVGALSKGNAEPAKVEMMVDELATLGSDDGWGNTHNNSLAMMALRNRLDAKRESGATAALTLDVGGNKESLVYKAGEGALKRDIASQDPGVIALQVTESIDSMYVKLFERYVPTAPGSRVAAAQEGFVVKRRIVYPSGTQAPSKRFWIDEPGKQFDVPRGAIIEEQVQVTNPSDRTFVAVVIPLAAGFEYLNPELKTASADFAPEGTTSDPGSYQAFYDDKIAYYFKSMKKGTYDFYFRVRATTEGSFTQPPAIAEMMYEDEIRGNSPGSRIVVTAE